MLEGRGLRIRAPSSRLSFAITHKTHKSPNLLEYVGPGVQGLARLMRFTSWSQLCLGLQKTGTATSHIRRTSFRKLMNTQAPSFALARQICLFVVLEIMDPDFNVSNYLD